MEQEFSTPEHALLVDERKRASGFPAFFIGLLLFASVIFAWRAIVSATASFQDGHLVTALTTAVAAGLWVLGGIGLYHNGKKMRIVAYISCVINAVVPLVGLFADLDFAWVNPWRSGGATYFYLPTVGAVLALAWLLWSNPANVARRNS